MQLPNYPRHNCESYRKLLAAANEEPRSRQIVRLPFADSHKPSKTYTPNGEQECARRRRQLAL